jgi:hypothetical protein
MTKVDEKDIIEATVATMENVENVGSVEIVANAHNVLKLDEIPSVLEVKNIMRRLSEELYEAWKLEIADRLRNLEFEGCICKEHIVVSDAVWRLPNDEVRYALCKLEEELRFLGYDYEFKFNDVDDVHWVMFYSVSLPERDEDATCDACDDETKTINSEESELDFSY